MSTFQKIRFVLTIEQLYKVLANSGAVHGLVLDLSVKEDYITVIDVNGYKLDTSSREISIPTANAESAIPTPPGAHGTVNGGIEIIDLNLSNDSVKTFFETKLPFTQPMSLEIK